MPHLVLLLLLNESLSKLWTSVFAILKRFSAWQDQQENIWFTVSHRLHAGLVESRLGFLLPPLFFSNFHFVHFKIEVQQILIVVSCLNCFLKTYCFKCTSMIHHCKSQMYELFLLVVFSLIWWLLYWGCMIPSQLLQRSVFNPNWKFSMPCYFTMMSKRIIEWTKLSWLVV